MSAWPYRFAISVGATLLALLASFPAHASNRPENITDAERAMLPPYCPYTMGEKGHRQPHIGKWVGIMGESFFHMHHHCWSLIDFGRAERAGLSQSERKFLRQRALGGFLYVIRNASEDFILLPEIYTWIGRTEILLNHPKSAGEAFDKARQLKADYWPPYYHWAEYLQSHGQKNEALRVIKVGLQYSPSAKPLLLLYRQLGGKSSDVPPLTSQSEKLPEKESALSEKIATDPGDEKQ